MVRQPSFDSNGMKKGAWSQDEDEKLRAYITRYNHWNWRLLPKYAGLARCGKSCRLRWLNYLKPGLKKGNFSKQEQDLIVELHAQLGNRWSAIASKLPGRSDNEIKNFWHTRINKRSNGQLYQPAAKVNSTDSAIINHTKEEALNDDQLFEQQKPSQIVFCESSPIESYSFESLITELEDSTLSFDTKSFDSVEKPQVDFWTTDIILESDTAYSQINCLPTFKEDNFPMSNHIERSDFSYQGALDWNNIANDEHSLISSDYMAHDEPVVVVGGRFPPSHESFVSYTSNFQSENNNCISENIEGLNYDPCLEYFDYGMDFFS